MKYAVKFIYDGMEPGFFYKKKVEREFLEAYSLFCDRVNPLISEWNSEYDNTGLPVDGVDDDGYTIPCQDSKYNSFMKDKYAQVVNMLNKTHSTSRIRKFLIDDYVNFKAVLNDGTKMSFVLIPS